MSNVAIPISLVNSSCFGHLEDCLLFYMLLMKYHVPNWKESRSSFYSHFHFPSPQIDSLAIPERLRR